MNEFDESKLYATRLVNNSDAEWPVYEKGRKVTTVPPHEESLIESWRPDTTWSRFEKAVKGKDGKITCHENPSWQNPWQDKFYCIELLNEDGSPEESVAVLNCPVADPNGFVTAMRGVPVLIPLNIMDPLVRYVRIIWHKKERRVEVPGTLYFDRVVEVVKEMVPRAKQDLKNVLKERQAIEDEKMRDLREKMMKAQERLLMGEDR